MPHTCHAIGCETPVPPVMHMCKPHWRMVSALNKSRLLAAYRPGQENDKRPTGDYCRAAALTISEVARKDGVTPKSSRR